MIMEFDDYLVEYDFIPGEAGAVDSMGVPVEPSYPDTVEIITIRCRNNGEFYFVWGGVYSEIKKECLKHYREFMKPNDTYGDDK